MENLKFDEFLRAGEPGAMSVASACARLQKLLTTELSTPLHLHSVDSRRKFFAFFPRFLDRVFGEDSEKQQGVTKNTAWISSPSHNAASEPSTNHAAQRPTSPRANGPNSHLGDQGQALVELFEKSLFDFVCNVSHAVRFRLDMTLLPPPAQVEMRNSGVVTPLYAKLFLSPNLSVNGKSQCFMVPIQSYFLFTFLRYPVSTSKLKRPTTTTNNASTSTGSSSSAPSNGNYWWRSTFLTEGMESLTRRHPYNSLLLYYLQTFLPHGPEKLSFKSGRKQSMELFLNLLVEIWLHQNQVTYGSENNIHPLTLVKAVDQYTPPTDDLLSSLLLTIVHVLGDSHVPLFPSTHIVLKAIQKPLYDFFQIGFARSSPDTNPTSFCMFVDVFLAYLQPWQCKNWGESSSTTASYSSEYSSYVLANYHFYTTLFGVFIVNARELEWDAPCVQMLERALNIYTKDLLQLLQQAYCFLNQTQTSNPLTAAEGNILTRHINEFGLTSYGVSLSQDFRRNAEHVLDKLQYARDVNPKPSNAFLSSVFSTTSGSHSSGAANGSLESIIESTSTRLRAVFEIPDSYVPASSFQAPLARIFSLSSLEPSRDENNYLTAQGRIQVQQGKRLCSIETVRYTGDPMLKPISSYEIPFLVRMWYKISVVINTLLDPTDTSFRVNLRFLAAKSNVLWLSTFIVLTYLFLW